MAGPPAMVRDAGPSSPGLPSLISPTRPLYAALDAAGVSLAAISAAPDADAFLGGLQVVLGIAFTVIVGLIGLSAIRKVIGS